MLAPTIGIGQVFCRHARLPKGHHPAPRWRESRTQVTREERDLFLLALSRSALRRSLLPGEQVDVFAVDFEDLERELARG